MPADLDDQLRALGTALLRDSTPIALDELTSMELPAEVMPIDRLPEARVGHRRLAFALGIASIAAAVVTIALIGPRSGNTPGGLESIVPGTGPSVTGQTRPSSALTVASGPTSAPAASTTSQTTAPGAAAIARTLSFGLAGDDVARVQEQLISLGFDPGPADGIYGHMTTQAVWAFETLVLGVPLDAATGAVTPETWERMLHTDAGAYAPRRSVPDATHTEIYLPEQVLIVYDDDRPVLVTHVSTGALDARGEPASYCETVTIDTDVNGVPLDEPEEHTICGYSKTPGGIFDVDRFVPGTRHGPLGSTWNPIYFNYGISIHGAVNVPLIPSSHGNVRVPMHVSERLPDLVPVGSRVYVWAGVTEPEDQTGEAMTPSFPWPASTTVP